jgi:uncharacterized Zn finger protein (UPF0148 family)
MKMLQGYSLRDTQCEQCGMPQMEFKSIVHCVVCPVLGRKARKELRKLSKSKLQSSKGKGSGPGEQHDEKKDQEEAIVDQILQRHEDASSAKSDRREQSSKQSIHSLSTDQESTKGTSVLSKDSSKKSIQSLSADDASSDKSIKPLQDEASVNDGQAGSDFPTKAKADLLQLTVGEKRKEAPQQNLIAKSPKYSYDESNVKLSINPPITLSFKKSTADAKPEDIRKAVPPKDGPKTTKGALSREGQLDATETPTAGKLRKVGKACMNATESHGSKDTWLFVSLKAPLNIKSADTRRKTLDALEKTLLEEARILKAETKKLIKEESSIKGTDRSPDFKKRRDETVQAAELCKAQLNLIVETKRLESMERMRLANEIEFTSPQESLLAVFALQEERKRLRKEAVRLENTRKESEVCKEKRKAEAGKKSEIEVRHIANAKAQEKEAKREVEEAQMALYKAKLAMDEARSKKSFIADVIAQGEADTIAETEAIVRAQAEDYYEKKILPSPSALWRERWETLRLEGRSVVTRRLISGYTMLPNYCKGRECQRSPLLTNGGRVECVVCGGSGNGKDGAYDNLQQEETNESCTLSSSNENYATTHASTTGASQAFAHEELNLSSLRRPGEQGHMNALGTAYPTERTKIEISAQQIHEDFEEKRLVVSKEIGKRMLQGWTLLDMSCPNCVMPLLTDEDGKNEICVLCGVVGKLNYDGSEDDQYDTGTATFNTDSGDERHYGKDAYKEKLQTEALNSGWGLEYPVVRGYDEATQKIKELKSSCGDAAPEYCAEEQARLAVFSSHAAAYMSHARTSIKAKLDLVATKQHDVANVISNVGTAYIHDKITEFEENCSPNDMARMHDMQANFVETTEHLTDMFKEGEAVVGKRFQETSAFLMKRQAVQDMVALMSEAPCSPRTGAIESVTSAIQRAYYQTKPEQKAVRKTQSEKPETKAGNANTKIAQGSFEDLANQLSKADANYRRTKTETAISPCLTDEDGTVDSLLPQCDQSVIEDSIPSPRKTSVKKGAAAVALELIKEHKSKADSDSENPGHAPNRSFFPANQRVLKSLTIDTTPGNHVSETPMSPRTPKTAISARSTLGSSPRASPSNCHVRSSPRYGMPPGLLAQSPTKKFENYNERLRCLLEEYKSHGSVSRFRGIKSAPTSPQKYSPASPNFLIQSISGRRSNPSNPQIHADPPAMVSNHVIGASGRRVARDPEDRSVVDDSYSISSSVRFSRSPHARNLSVGSINSPGGRMSPSQRSFSFPDSPSKAMMTKQEDECVTLVIPKDFDVTNDSQLRNLILAAKRGYNASPTNARLSLEGRIKNIGDTEIIDVIDMEMDENLDFANSLRMARGRGRLHPPSPGEMADCLPSLRRSPHGGANDIVVARMHPPSPGESPFNGRTSRKPRPKITPESMLNRKKPSLNRSSPGPTGRSPSPMARRDRSGNNHNHISSTASGRRIHSPRGLEAPPSPRGPKPAGSGSSGSFIKLENGDPDQLFSSNSTDLSLSKGHPGDRRTVLSNMSFSSSGENSRYTCAEPGENKDSYCKESSFVSNTTVGLPPISPRKARRRPSTGSVDAHTGGESVAASSCTGFGINAPTGDNSTILSRDSGLDTGVTFGRSSSSDQSTYGGGRDRSQRSGSFSSMDGVVDGIRVLNSSDQSGIEVAAHVSSPRTTRRSRRQVLAATKQRASARGGGKKECTPGQSGLKDSASGEILSITSTTFDGIIRRIDSCKSKLAPSGGGASVGHGGRKEKDQNLVNLIGKLTVAAEGVKNVGSSGGCDSLASEQ